jgi:hypothetical protein
MIIMNPAKYVQPTAQPLLLVSKDLPFLETHRGVRCPVALKPRDIRVAMSAQIRRLGARLALRDLASIVRMPGEVGRPSEVRTVGAGTGADLSDIGGTNGRSSTDERIASLHPRSTTVCFVRI